MDRAGRISIARALLDLLDGKTTSRAERAVEIDAARYVDPGRFAHERRRLFLEFPQVVGLSCDLPEPGSWSTLDVAGVPALLVRGEDGEFRAFINACRHRGARVADGCGRGSSGFVCPWHAWTYDERGRLVGVPDRASFESLRLDHRSLTTLCAHERYGLLIVLPTPGRSFDPDDVLRGIGPQIEAFGTGAMHRVDTREIRIPANWKLAVDTGLEVYHVASPREDSGPRAIAHTQTFETFGLHQRMAIPLVSIVELHDRPEREWGDPLRHFQLVHHLFPATDVTIAGERIALLRADPGSHPGETVLRFSSYAWRRPETGQEEDAARLGFAQLARDVSVEHYRLAAQAQKSFEAEPGRSVLIGRNEIGIQALHRSYDALLGS